MRTSVLLQLQDLFDEVHEFGPADADGATLHFMGGLCRLLRADNAFWVGSVRLLSGPKAQRDNQHGWRGRSVMMLHSTAPRRVITARSLREQDKGAPSMSTHAITGGAGHRRVRRLRELVPFAVFRRTAHFRTLLAPIGLVDRLFAVTPVNADAESYFCFDHCRSRRRFSPADALLAGLAVRGLKGLHRELMLSRGLLVGRTSLEPNERRVVGFLLTELPEKAIAA